MISRQFIDNFIRLFKEKRYQELIDQSDIMTSKEERPSGLSNLNNKHYFQPRTQYPQAAYLC